MIHDHLRITGTSESMFDFSDLVGTSFREDNVNLNKMRVRDSEQLKSTMTLYLQDSVQGEETNCTRLNDRVRRFLEQKRKDKKLDAKSND